MAADPVLYSRFADVEGSRGTVSGLLKVQSSEVGLRQGHCQLAPGFLPESLQYLLGKITPVIAGYGI
ncbi:hypothetical protein D3C75_1347520 [compost metagenome]